MSGLQKHTWPDVIQTLSSEHNRRHLHVKLETVFPGNCAFWPQKCFCACRVTFDLRTKPGTVRMTRACLVEIGAPRASSCILHRQRGADESLSQPQTCTSEWRSLSNQSGEGGKVTTLQSWNSEREREVWNGSYLIITEVKMEQLFSRETQLLRVWCTCLALITVNWITKESWRAQSRSTTPEAPAEVTTWVWRGGAPVAAEWRSLKGVHHVAVGDGRQVVFVWKGALKTRRVQLCEDDLRREKPQWRRYPLCLQTQRKQSSENIINRFDPRGDFEICK